MGFNKAAGDQLSASELNSFYASAGLYGASSAGSDTYAITVTPAPNDYDSGDRYQFKADVANTGAATLNVNGLGAKTLKKFTPSGKVDLATDDIIANQLVTVQYDGTDFIVISRLSHDSTKEFFVPFSRQSGTLGSLGAFAIATIGNSQSAEFNFNIPNDFNSLVSMVVIHIPDTTETIQWDTTIDYGANSETYSSANASDLNRTQSVTISKITESNVNQGNVATATASLAAGDYVGLDFTSNTDSLRVVGLRVKYS